MSTNTFGCQDSDFNKPFWFQSPQHQGSYFPVLYHSDHFDQGQESAQSIVKEVEYSKVQSGNIKRQRRYSTCRCEDIFKVSTYDQLQPQYIQLDVCSSSFQAPQIKQAQTLQLSSTNNSTPLQLEPQSFGSKLKTIEKKEKINRLTLLPQSRATAQKKNKIGKSETNQNNITTHIVKSAARTAILTTDLQQQVQKLLRKECQDQGIIYEQFKAFAAELYQQSYHSLSSLNQLLSPSQEPSCKNVFIRYFKWFLECEFTQKLLNESKMEKRTMADYLGFKNRFLQNLAFFQPNPNLQYLQ